MSGEDFNAAPVEVVIPASTMENESVCVNISLMVIDDHIVESPETFTIELTGSTPPVEIGYPSSATVTIIDNDSEFKEKSYFAHDTFNNTIFICSEVTIGLETCEYTVTEGESQNICASLDGSLQRPVNTHLSIGPSSKRPNISEQSHLVVLHSQLFC